ncbi:hypothetical protein OSTOST_10086 [Ostertagia ostertagi]
MPPEGLPNCPGLNRPDRKRNEVTSFLGSTRRGALFCRSGNWLEIIDERTSQLETRRGGIGDQVRGTRREGSRFKLFSPPNRNVALRRLARAAVLKTSAPKDPGFVVRRTSCEQAMQTRIERIQERVANRRPTPPAMRKLRKRKRRRQQRLEREQRQRRLRQQELERLREEELNRKRRPK